MAQSSSVTLYAQWKKNTYNVKLYSNLLYGLQDTTSAVVADSISYTIKDRVITATAIATSHDSDFYGFTSGRVMLEAGTTYQFTLQHAGIYGSEVEIFFMLNGKYEKYYHMNCGNSSSFTFTPDTSGEYHMRMDVNRKNDTQSVSNVNVGKLVSTIDVTYNDKYSALPTSARTGYRFLNWQDEVGNIYTTSTQVTKTQPHSLYAQWDANQYTVVFNANGGSGSMSSQKFIYDIAQNLTTNAFTRSGYTFIGWNTQADGNGISYIDSASVKNLTATHGGTVTLYAQWGARIYNIEFHSNGGTGTMLPQTAAYDKVFTLQENQFVKTGYSFMGWATSSGAATYTYIDQQEVVNLAASGTVHLYAVWKQNTYTVSFDYCGGTGSIKSTQVIHGGQYGTLPTYHTKDGYLFTGWYTAPSDGTRVYPTTQVQNADHTLYAHWVKSPYNPAIKKLVIKNNPDDDGDGVVDDVSLQFECGSNFEKYNIPLGGLTVGQQYRLTYSVSNDAKFGDSERNYGTALFGSYIVENQTLDTSNVSNAIAEDIISSK